MSKFAGAVATVILSLVLAACGGGSSSSTSSAGDTTSSEPSATASDTTGGGSGSSGALTSAQCAELAASMAAAAGGVGPESSTNDPSSMADFLRRAAAGAPADLRDDFITVADGLEKFYTTLKNAGIDLTDPSTYSSQAAGATLSKAAQQLQNDVGDAATRIQSRFNELCGSSN